MNIPYTTARGSIRFSLSRYTTAENIDQTISVLSGIIAKLVEMSPFEKELQAAADSLR